MLTSEQIDALKADFLEWSGGFEPESFDTITVYIDYACDYRLDGEEVRRVLTDWMNADAPAFVGRFHRGSQS